VVAAKPARRVANTNSDKIARATGQSEYGNEVAITSEELRTTKLSLSWKAGGDEIASRHDHLPSSSRIAQMAEVTLFGPACVH
jgi:hypothetical protein